MVTAFQQKVYDKLLEVPAGRVTTYRDLAHSLGINSSQAIGQALKRNPFAPRVPCHRVVSSNGSIGGYMGAVEGSPIAKKIDLLKKEGINIVDGKVVDFELQLFTFRT